LCGAKERERERERERMREGVRVRGGRQEHWKKLSKERNRNVLDLAKEGTTTFGADIIARALDDGNIVFTVCPILIVIVDVFQRHLAFCARKAVRMKSPALIN
jgi:hypothetical protein